MGHEVAAAVGQAEADPAVVGIVLTGAGRGFCAGADLGMLVRRHRRAGRRRLARAAPQRRSSKRAVAMPGDADAGDDLRGPYTYLMSLAKPVIAAINGPVAGMGVPVALACDIRLMSTSAVHHHLVRPARADRRVGHRLAAVAASSARRTPSTCCSPPARSAPPRPNGSASSTAPSQPTTCSPPPATTSSTSPSTARRRRSP